MPKVTKRLVEGIKPANRDVLQWDSELRGFGVRVKSSGVRSYLVQYRNQHGRSRRLTIGTHGRWSCRGPPFVKIGAAVRYDPDDIESFIEAGRRSSTSDPGRAAK